MTTCNVTRICREAGIRQRNRLDDEKLRQARDRRIVERVKAGEHRTALAKEFGMTVQHLSYICRQAGIRRDSP